MKAFVFPGQGAQFVGMGKDLYEQNETAKQLFEKANEILGYRITDIMFEGTDEDLKQTKVTQPAVFLHSVISAICMGDAFDPKMTAGHSLGEFSEKNTVCNQTYHILKLKMIINISQSLFLGTAHISIYPLI